MNKLYKKYVPVVTLMGENGEIKPMGIVWNRTYFKIERIEKTRKAYSKVGGAGILYEIIVEGKKRNLFFERDRFFIESKQM